MSLEMILDRIVSEINAFEEDNGRLPTVIMSYELFKKIMNHSALYRVLVLIWEKEGSKRKIFGCELKLFNDTSIRWIVGQLNEEEVVVQKEGGKG